MGILEILVALMAVLAVIGVTILSITKLVKSRLNPNQKIMWTAAMIIFHLLGLVVFLIYHDYYLSPELRAN